MTWIDGEAMVTRRTPEGEAEVGHAFAAKSNLNSALESLRRALPDVIGEKDRSFVDSFKEFDPNLGTVLVGLPLYLAYGAVEAVIMTALAAKDAVDAAVHGILAGFQD